MITVITMYRCWDAESFVQVVEGTLTDKEKDAWREYHTCDNHHKCSQEPPTSGDCDCDNYNNMFFRVLEPRTDHKPINMANVDMFFRVLEPRTDHKPINMANVDGL